MTHILAWQEADNKSVHMLEDGCIIGLNKLSKTKFLPHQSDEGKGQFPFGDLLWNDLFSDLV